MRRLHQHILILISFCLLLFGLTAYVTLSETGDAGARSDPFPGSGPWAERQLDALTLEEKVSQLFVVASTGNFLNVDDPDFQLLVDLVEDFGIGGIIFFRGEPLSQLALTNDLQGRAHLPLLIGQDMEWGAGMRVESATAFPQMMAIGASRNEDYAYGLGAVTAREARALGVHQVYAPVADVNNNPSNPVISTRSYGENPELVARMVTAHVEGLQTGGVIATAKHFPGHGDTSIDSHLDLPVLPFSRARLDDVELVPFRAVIDRGVKSIMTGHLSLPEIDSDSLLPASLSPVVSTDLLRDDLGFDGLIVTDAMNMGGVAREFGPGEAAVLALEAGADLLLMSTDVYAARSAVLEALESGRLSVEQIDDSAERLLRAKEWLGLHTARIGSPEEARRVINAPSHQMMAETIARSGLTLLSNEGNLIPLVEPPRDVMVMVVSNGSDPEVGSDFIRHLRALMRESSVSSRLLDARSDKPDFDAAVSAALDHEVVIIASYVQAGASSGPNALSPLQQAFIDHAIREASPVILVSFGSPYIASEVTAPAAYLVAYGAGDVTQTAVAEALTGRAGLSGKLPVTVPGHYDYGAGLETRQMVMREGFPEEVGMSTAELQRVDALMRKAIEERAFPAAAVAVGRAGVVPWLKGYGHFTYGSDRAVTAETVFDIASLTKVLATTTAVMKLYERGKIDLEAPVTQYLPRFGVAGKGAVTIRHLLSHSAGLPAYTPFHALGYTTREAVLDSILTQPLVYRPGTEYRYSDHGFILLALIIERITGHDFAEFIEAEVFEPLDMHDTGFRSTVEGGTPDVVPTERDRIFRRRLLQGEVHDETAWILGGVAGNAGLFSTAADLARFGYMLVNRGRVNGQQFVEEETLQLFTTPIDRGRENTRALGWDTRSSEGYSSAGTLFGPHSFGHTGYTGTSFWVDPDQQLFVVLLTNRVYPTRRNTAHNQVRSDLADIAYEAVVAPPAPILPLGLRRSELPVR